MDKLPVDWVVVAIVMFRVCIKLNREHSDLLDILIELDEKNYVQRAYIFNHFSK